MLQLRRWYEKRRERCFKRGTSLHLLDVDLHTLEDHRASKEWQLCKGCAQRPRLSFLSSPSFCKMIIKFWSIYCSRNSWVKSRGNWLKNVAGIPKIRSIFNATNLSILITPIKVLSLSMVIKCYRSTSLFSSWFSVLH